MSPIWIARAQWLSGGIFTIAPVFIFREFVPGTPSLWIGIPLAVICGILGWVGSIFLWRFIAESFGWELPIDDDDDDETSS